MSKFGQQGMIPDYQSSEVNPEEIQKCGPSGHQPSVTHSAGKYRPWEFCELPETKFLSREPKCKSSEIVFNMVWECVFFWGMNESKVLDRFSKAFLIQ